MDRDEPLAVLVEFAQHERPVGQPIELVLDEQLDEGALVLQDEDLLQPGGELPDDPALERVGHPQLQQAHTEALQLPVVQPQLPQGLAHLEIGLAGRNDPHPVGVGAQGDPVDVVGPGIGQGCPHPAIDHGVLHLHDPGAVHVGRGSVQIGPPVLLDVHHDRLDAPRSHHRRPGPVGDRGRHFHRHPQTTRPREGHGVLPQVEDLLDIARIEHRHHDRCRRDLTGPRRRRRLGGRVVSDQGQRAARTHRAGEVGLAQRIQGPVEPVGLAVPEAQHPVETRARQLHRQLAAHDGGRPELLVDSHLMDDVMGVHQPPAPLQFQVKTAQRRAWIARDEGGGVETGREVQPSLHHGQPDEGLHPREVDDPLVDGELVLQRQRWKQGAAHLGILCPRHTGNRCCERADQDVPTKPLA
ncbi:MAG: hypothetical protein BWY91_01849 [bacterium ADurb.BinA028]|nr:MAG: hypothetical protein BWY91_01849 [bacterium ADurb.BinA028]